MTIFPRDLSVTEPIGRAIDHTRQVLFRPFDLGKWFAIGFCAWLALLGQGGGAGGGFNYGNGGSHKGWGGMRDGLRSACDYFMHNLVWILPLIAGILVVGLILWVFLLWLSSRGRFMFLHCVARNTGEVTRPWAEYRREANSLFMFRLIVALIELVLMLPAVGFLLFIIFGMIMRESVNPVGILLCVLLVLVMVVAGIFFWIIDRITQDFVVPLQYLRRTACLNAWSELREMFRGNLGSLVIYLLFRIVISMAIGALVFAAMIVTCCIACCLLALPFIGTVVLLPVLVFERAYPLFYLAQFGPAHNAFAAPTDSLGLSA